MSGCEATDEVKAILKAMAKNRVAAGHSDAAEVIDSIHDAIHEHTPLYKSEIADIVSGYGQVRKPSKNELTTRMNALKAELRDDARKGDIAMGKVDPAAEAAAKRKAQLQRRITALEAKIKAGDTGKPTAKPVDSPEHRALTDKLKALQKQLKALRPAKPAKVKGAPDPVAARKRSLVNQILEINRRLRERDFTRSKGKAPADADAETKALVAKRNELRKQLRIARDGPKPTAEQRQLQQIKKQIADVRDRLAGKPAKPAAAKPARTAKVRDAQAELDALRKELRDANRPAKKSRDEIRQAQITKQIAAIEERLRTGDFSKVERKPVAYSDDTLELQTRLERARRAVDSEMAKLEAQNRSRPQKVWDTFLAFRRAVILSSFHTLGKLTSAATQRMITTPTEEAIGSVLRLVPGLRAIDAKAPREGGGFNPTAEAAALKTTFSKDTLRQMWDMAAHGAGKLDLLHGKHDHPIRGLLDVIGQIHGALKTPAKINEFTRAVIKRTAHARAEMIAAGKTPAEADKQLQSPTTQAMIAAKAYEDGQRAILMSDNPVVSGYRMVLSHAKRQGASGKVVAGVMEYLLPIVKIPTNFVAETSSYAAGAPKALGQLIAAGGIGKLKPDQADYIIRNLKKQTVGASLLALGYMAEGLVSGYYQPGDNKKKGLHPAGTMWITVNGVEHEVPKFLIHSPPMEILQMGATIRRVEQAEKGSTAAGAFAAFKGLVGEIPFFDTPMRVAHAMTDLDSLAQYAGGEVRGAFIPPDVQKLAKMVDDDRERKPKGFLDSIEAGIPGLRDNVAEKSATHRRARRDRSHD